MRKTSLFLILLSVFQLNAQILIDNNTPYDNPASSVDNVLFGGGITTSNHAYQGDSVQIGWFDATNTNLGINSGVVMATGDIYALDPINGGTFPFLTNLITDSNLISMSCCFLWTFKLS